MYWQKHETFSLRNCSHYVLSPPTLLKKNMDCPQWAQISHCMSCSPTVQWTSSGFLMFCSFTAELLLRCADDSHPDIFGKLRQPFYTYRVYDIYPPYYEVKRHKVYDTLTLFINVFVVPRNFYVTKQRRKRNRPTAYPPQWNNVYRWCPSVMPLMGNEAYFGHPTLLNVTVRLLLFFKSSELQLGATCGNIILNRRSLACNPLRSSNAFGHICFLQWPKASLV